MSTVPHAPSAPHSEDPDARRVREMFSVLLKSIKTIGIYRHAETRYTEYLEPAFDAMTKFLSDKESLPLKLEPFALKYHNHVIYEDHAKENLTYKFYKDGVRFLIFRRGLPMHELLSFVLLAMENLQEAQLSYEDSVTRLWKNEHQFIEHVVVEGFGFGDLSEEQVEVEVEKVVGHLRSQLAANSRDVARFARLSLEDLELQLDEIEQVRGGIISGRPARMSDVSRLQDDLVLERQRIFSKMVIVLLQILEHDAEDEDQTMLSSAFIQILDSLLLAEDFKGAVSLLARFQTTRSRPLPAARKVMVERLEQEIGVRMVEPHRIEAVGRYLASTKDVDRDAVSAYFARCSEDHVPLLLEMLGKLERPEARELVVDCLVRVGKKHLGVFAERLTSASTNLVKDVLEIIQRLDPPNKLGLVAQSLRHANLIVRLEGLKHLARAKEPEAVRYIERAMADQDVQLRLGAYRALVARSPKRAVESLVELVSSDVFSSRDPREKTAIFVAIGTARSKESLDYLSSLFDAKAGLLQRSRVNELKQLAVAGLYAHGSLPAFKILAREVQNRGNSKEVALAAQQAAVKLRDKLQSPTNEGGQT
ncbi:MAG: HEAT repeat domain-containing protein [Myxococcales bacterium]|nr:HEAT repeat domain-containing protein [Myxococcales bacterium]